jgi:hypothetical protein
LVIVDHVANALCAHVEPANDDRSGGAVVSVRLPPLADSRARLATGE